MVGSDDEVEVARQERWLQRIREQFEAEHDGTEAADIHADDGMAGGAPPYNGNGAHASMGNGVPPAQPVHNGQPAYGRYDVGHGVDPDVRNGHHVNGHHAGTGHPADDAGVVDAVVDDDTGWLPAERSWLTGSPDDTSGQHTGAHDAWSQTASTAYSDPPTQGPVSQVDQWHTSDWEAGSRTQPWDATPLDTGQQAAWQPSDDRTSTWQPPATGGDAAPRQDPDWRHVQAGGDAPDDVWSDPDPAAHEEWAEIMPSQPPAQNWGAPVPEQRNGWHEPVPEPQADAWQPWQPDQHAPRHPADPVANGHRNGMPPGNASYFDDVERSEHHDVVHDGYDDVQYNGYDDGARIGYHEHSAPADVADPRHNGAYGAAGDPGPSSAASTGWSVGGPADDGHDGGDAQRGWEDDAEVVADPEPLDIWSPSAEDTWSPPADDQAWTPAHPPPTHPQAFGGDPSQTGPFETVDPGPPPGTDQTARWSAEPSPPLEDDPYRPEPQPGRRYQDTTTDPFEALQSLQSQLNRLGGNSRRPPRRYEE